jgi:hypothetical protein
MLRHVIEKRHPAVGILSIREAIRANQRVRELEAKAVELLGRGEWTSYAVGNRPAFEAGVQQPAQQAIGISASTTQPNRASPSGAATTPRTKSAGTPKARAGK